MFFRLLLESFRRQRRRKLLAGLAILLGTTAVTAMLALATTIGDRIQNELAVYGANIIVTPEAEALAVNIGGTDIAPTTGNTFLHQSDLPKLRTIFWANNITAISPELPITLTLLPTSSTATDPGTTPVAPSSPQPGAPSMTQSYRGMGGTSFAKANDRPLHSAQQPPMPFQVRALGLWFKHDLNGLKTGAPALHPLWKLTGAWPQAENEAVLGAALASTLNLQPGATLHLSAPATTSQPSGASTPSAIPLKITGIVTTGDQTDTQLLLPLETAQTLNQTPDAVSRIEISARTRPEDAFARVNPDTLSPKQRDLWYCRPYANSIAYQIREAIPNANAQQVRRVEQSEGNVLKRISGLMGLISAAALLSAGFAVSAAMATAVLERRAEIGLMRSLGASQGRIATLFYVEAAILALVAGVGGYLAGSTLAATLGAHIFTPAAQSLAQTGAQTAAGHAPIFNPVLLPITTGLALLVAIAGSTPAIRSALRLNPSAILRSDA